MSRQELRYNKNKEMTSLHDSPLIWVTFLALVCEASNTKLQLKNGNHTFRVCLSQPKGFNFTLSGARDIRQMHIFWNHRKPYNRSEPYSSTDFSNVSFNEKWEPTLTVSDDSVPLRIGDSIFYWLLLINHEWERIPIHKLNFWVKFDGVPQHFAETYYRDYDNYHSDEL